MGQFSVVVKISICAALSVILVFSVQADIRRSWREEQAGALEGDLRGAGKTLDDGVQRPVPFLQIGDSGTMFIMVPQKGKLEPYFQFFYDAGFKVEYGKQGPLVSTAVRDRFGNLVVNVTENHWTVYQPYCMDKNYNYNKDTLEVLDSSGHVVFQLRILPNRVQVQGEWWDNQGNGRRVMKAKGRAESGAEILLLGAQNQHNEKLIDPIFKYPSKYFWGEFVKN